MFDLDYYKSINNDTHIKKIFKNLAECDGIRKTDQLSILSGFLKNRNPVIIKAGI